MRSRRERPPAPLIIALAISAAAAFFGGGASTRTLPWVGGAAVVAVAALVVVRGLPRGWPALVPLVALALWCALSIAWSDLGDRSWDYANRTLVYAAFAALGLFLADRTRELAAGLAAVLGAVVVWSLAGKALPWLYDDYGRIARLRAPVGIWNQLALLGDYALPLALWLGWRRRVLGALLAYAWLVAIVLTYSRGGVLVAVAVVVAWIVLSRRWVEAGATLLAAGVPTAGVVAVALALPGVTDDGQTHATRVRDGAVSAVVVGAVAVGAVAVRAPSLWRDFTSATETQLPNSSARFAAAGSNHRWVWWKQAWNGWEERPVVGTGAGSFALTNLRYRTTFLDQATEPHNVPLQFLSETGLVGLALLLAALGSLIAAAGRRRGHELALSLLLPAFVLHALLDIDWDFLAVAAPAFLAAGALAGRPGGDQDQGRRSRFAALAAGGVALAVVSSLALPWLGERWTRQAEDAALAGRPAKAVALAKRARAADPVSIEPLFAQALAEE